MNFNSGIKVCPSLILIIRGEKKAKPRSTFLKSHPWWCRVRSQHLIHHICTCAMFIALIILLPVAYWIQLRRMEIKTKRTNWNESAEREWGKVKQQQQWKLSNAFSYFEYIYFASNMSLLLNLRDFTLLIFTFSVFAVSRCSLALCVCVFLLCDRLLSSF